MATTHASITVETAMTSEPADERSVPPDAVDELTDDENEAEHPDDVHADDGEDVGLLVVVPDDDVAAQVHHAGHDRQARDRRDDGGRNARSSQDLAGAALQAPCSAPRQARVPRARARARSCADPGESRA